MTTNRKPFMPLDPDLVDDRLERLAAEKGVGKFEKPAKVAGEGTPLAQTAATGDMPPATANASSRLKTVNLELPDYVWTELKIRAAHQQTSLKHVVMKALRKDGITIQDADMIEDGRRLRGGNRPASVQHG